MPFVDVRLGEGERPAAEAANFFHFTWVADQVELLVGYLSLEEVHSIVQRNPDAEDQEQLGEVVNPQITHRLMMSMSGFEVLRERMNQMSEMIEAKKAQKAGGNDD